MVVFQGDVAIFSAGNDIMILQQPCHAFASVPLPAPRPPPSPSRSPRCGWLRALAPPCCSIAIWFTRATTRVLHAFVNLGLVPEAASSLLVPQMLGYHRAAEATAAGRALLCRSSLEVGLVNRVATFETQRRGKPGPKLAALSLR